MYHDQSRSTGLWGTRLLGGLLALIGVILAGGGGWLLALGGSPYYLIAGLGLIVSGILIARGNAAGAWLYIAIFLATLVWALWESGLDIWAMVPRTVGPFVLLLLVIAALPALTRRRVRWPAAFGGLRRHGRGAVRFRCLGRGHRLARLRACGGTAAGRQPCHVRALA